MCKCEHVIDGNSIQFCLSSNENLYQRLADLQKENDELKAKLEEKRVPAKDALVRDKDTGRIYYSLGRRSNAGSLLVTYKPFDWGKADTAISNWEEIEIKVKE